MNVFRRRLSVLKLVVLSLSLFLLCGMITSPTFAQGGNPATVIHLTGRGLFASFAHTDPTGCITTGVSVVGNAAELTAVLAQSDICRGITLHDGEGSITTGFTFNVSNNLRSGHITGTVPIGDRVTDTTINIHVDLSFVGTGPIQASGGAVVQKFPGGIEIQQINTRSRSASATGVVSDGTTNVAANGSLTAQIFDSEATTITVSRG